MRNLKRNICDGAWDYVRCLSDVFLAERTAVASDRVVCKIKGNNEKKSVSAMLFTYFD